MNIFGSDLGMNLSRFENIFLSSKEEIEVAAETHIFEDCKYPLLASAVNKVMTSIQCVRSSAVLVRALNDIIGLSVNEILKSCWTLQCVKVRLDAVMKLIVPLLCFPHISSIFGDNSVRKSHRYGDVTFLNAIKLKVIESLTFFIDAELTIFQNGNVSTMDIHRVHLCISLLSFRSTEFSSILIVMREYAPIVLRSMSLHLLSVMSISVDVSTAVTRLVEVLIQLIMNDRIKVKESDIIGDHYPNALGVHFKSPMDDYIPLLHVHVYNYFNWLRTHFVELCKECRICEVIETTVHPSLRSSLKNECYTSMYDLLSRYHSKYKKHLSNMVLPLYAFDRDDIEQALKDVTRETFLLNNDTVDGHEVTGTIRRAIKDTYRLSGSKDKNPLFPGMKLLNTDLQTKKDFIDITMRYMLIAMSRTFSSGDAFFVVDDLFNDENCILCSQSTEAVNSQFTKVVVSEEGVVVRVLQKYTLMSNSNSSSSSTSIPLISFVTKICTVVSFRDLLKKKRKAALSSSTPSAADVSPQNEEGKNADGLGMSGKDTARQDAHDIAISIDDRNECHDSTSESVEDSPFDLIEYEPEYEDAADRASISMQDSSIDRFQADFNDKNQFSPTYHHHHMPDKKDVFTVEELAHVVFLLSTSPENICHRFLTITPMLPQNEEK